MHVTCWGADGSEQLGNGIASGGTTAATSLVAPPSGYTDVVIGSLHTCALTLDGSVTCWGSNDLGQLGNATVGGFLDAPATEVALPGGLSAVALAAGGRHTCALLTDGQMTCWGSDSNGQLGNGAVTGTVPAPVSVVPMPGGQTVVAIEAYGLGTCAVLASGDATCWGSDYGEVLGNGPGTADVDTPPAPISFSGNFAVAEISMNQHHAARCRRVARSPAGEPSTAVNSATARSAIPCRARPPRFRFPVEVRPWLSRPDPITRVPF